MQGGLVVALSLSPAIQQKANNMCRLQRTCAKGLSISSSLTSTMSSCDWLVAPLELWNDAPMDERRVSERSRGASASRNKYDCCGHSEAWLQKRNFT